MKNIVTNNVGSSAVAQSTETIKGIPDAKGLWDIYDLCYEASKQNEEYFEFIFENKKYSAQVDITYLIYELDGGDDDLGDMVGEVFIDDPDFSHFNGTIFG